MTYLSGVTSTTQVQRFLFPVTPNVQNFSVYIISSFYHKLLKLLRINREIQFK